VKHFSFIAILLTLLGFLDESPVNAGIITYTETFTDSGTLGVDSFTNQLITLTATADSSSVHFTGLDYYVINNTTTVSITGLPTATFTDFMLTNDYPSGTHAGLEDGNVGLEIMDVQNSAFASYDLTTSTGLLTGPVGGNWGGGAATYGTDAGSLIFDVPTITLGTFEASLASVPEPSSYGLAAFLCFICFGGRVLRRFSSRSNLAV
jgi:hypothetical protein